MSNKYTRKELLDYIRHFWYEMNRTPGSEDFSDHPECPTSSTYEDRFGSWNNAKREAGVPLLTREDIQDEELIRDLQRADENTNEFLSISKYKEIGEFSERPHIDRFGSWNNAKEAAGLEITKAGTGYTPEELLDRLDTLWAELGDKPSESDINQSDGPTAQTYRNHFGSLDEARKKIEDSI